MIVHGFDMYRIFVSAPGDLARERDACRAVISSCNSDVAMPAKVLLVSVGLLEDGQIEGYRSAVADNIRQCTYLIQVFQDDWGPRNLFRKMFQTAIECRDDESMPMREIVVFMKEAPKETDSQILAFRKELEERQDIRIFHFADDEELCDPLRGVCREWVASILASGGGVRPESAGAGA